MSGKTVAHKFKEGDRIIHHVHGDMRAVIHGINMDGRYYIVKWQTQDWEDDPLYPNFEEHSIRWIDESYVKVKISSYSSRNTNVRKLYDRS